MNGSSRLSRRQLLRAGAVLGATPALAGVLAACGGSGSGSSGSSLSFWSRDTTDNGVQEAPLRSRLSAFDTANKSTTQVQFLTLAASSQKELAAITAGGLPTLGEQGQDVALEFAAGGHLTELDDVYASLRPKLVQLPEFAITKYNGHVYGVPWWLETRVLYYHKDLLAAAGVNPPTTWSEWLSAARELTKGTEQYGFVISGQGVFPGQFFLPLAASAGGSLLNAGGSLTTATDSFVEALTFIQELYSSAMPPGTPTYDATASIEVFLTKKAAMTWDNGEILQAIKTTQPGLLDSVGAVLTPPRDSSAVSRSFLGGFELFAFSSGQAASQAKSLIRFLYDDPSWYGNFVGVTDGTCLPVLSSSANEAQFSSGITKTLIQQLETAVRYAGPTYGEDKPYMGTAETNMIFANPVVDVWSKSATPSGAVATMLSGLQSLASQNS